MDPLRIILSPAKQMITDTDSVAPSGSPVFIEETKEVLSYLKGLTYEEAKALWKCNDKLASLNYDRLNSADLSGGQTPAILAYDGIAYKYMAPNVFEYGEFDYVEACLRILSAFYGVLKPMDGVIPYRLEMQAKAHVAGTDNLYAFWGRKLYDEITKDSHVIINLASKEYARCIEKYLTEEDTFITCIFGEIEKGKVVQKGVYAKMARGEMVRFMAEKHVTEPEEIKAFDRLGYIFRDDLSDEKTYVFIK